MRLDDIPEPGRSRLADLPCPRYEETPFVAPIPLSARRVAILSTAGLHRRTDPPFDAASADYRVLPDSVDPTTLTMSHVSANFDRSGFQQDLNTVFPRDRLHELAAEGIIGSVGATHYAVMGFTEPEKLAPAARDLARHFKADDVDTVILVPV